MLDVALHNTSAAPVLAVLTNEVRAAVYSPSRPSTLALRVRPPVPGLASFQPPCAPRRSHTVGGQERRHGAGRCDAQRLQTGAAGRPVPPHARAPLSLHRSAFPFTAPLSLHRPAFPFTAPTFPFPSAQTFVGLLKDRARRRDELHAVVLVIAHVRRAQGLTGESRAS